jgi:uncharacterized repeat protein (TIGR04138 family)
MENLDVNEVLRGLVQRDPRFTLGAYRFVQEALSFSVNWLNKPKEGPDRHVSGQELLEGMRVFALKEFGPLTKRVLNEFGVFECLDFGLIVFNLIEVGLLGKNDQDSIEDFAGGYDFDEAFRLPFLPKDRQVDILL